jgi:acetyltransferase-like isoleucine patch superfamily enzyme
MLNRIKKALINYSFIELGMYTFFHIYISFLGFFSTILFRIKTICWRIDVGSNLKIFGSVYIFKYPGSTIVIGKKFSSISNSSRALATSIFAPTSIKTLSSKAKIVIGNNVGLNGTSISSRSSVIRFEDNVMIAANVTIMDSDYHVVYPSVDRLINPGVEFDKDILIKKNVWIGTRSIILKGVTIGENSVIAAGSIVKNSIPPNVLAGGVPAKVIRKIDSNSG